MPVFLPGKSHELGSLVSYSPWGRKELAAAARLSSPATAARPGPRRRPPGRASFVTVSSPSEPARHRRCARGCKWRPLASAPPAALPARGRLGAQRPGRIPPPPPGEQSPRRLRPRRRPQRGLRARATNDAPQGQNFQVT